jgi:hypothetical protein
MGAECFLLSGNRVNYQKISVDNLKINKMAK